MGRTATKFSLLPALFLCPALFAQTPGSVEGVVYDGKTGLPLQGVSVYFGTDKGPHYETETDPSGRFGIAGMAKGDYGCHFEKSGYIPQYSGGGNSPLKPVHVAAGQDPVRLTVSLSTYAKLRGRVLDPEGKPVANAKVTLAALEETADDQGQFTFSQIVPGSYTLKATPGKSQVLVTPEGVKRTPGTPKRETSPGDERTELLPTWYPSVTQADIAEPIVVRGGDDLFGIEIRMQSLPVYRVRGKAFNLDGTPVRAGSITSFSQADLAVAASIFAGKTGGGGPLGYFTLSRSALPSPADQPVGIVRDGSFELASVPRGLRQFRVRPMAVDPHQLKEQLEAMAEARKRA